MIYVMGNSLFRRLMMLYNWRHAGFGLVFDFADSVENARLLLQRSRNT